MDAPGDGEAELELIVEDGVAADDARACFVHLVLAAAHDVGEHLERQSVPAGNPTMHSAVRGSPPMA